MVDATCIGCGADVIQHPRARNPKKWCSETCRVNAWRRMNPQRVAGQVARRAELLKTRTIVRNAGQACCVCGMDFCSRWPRKYCSDPCKFRAAHVARYAARKNAARSDYNLASVLSADFCGICLLEIDHSLSYPHPMCVSLDHIVPLARGGTDSAENVQAAHLVCNQRKGARIA